MRLKQRTSGDGPDRGLRERGGYGVWKVLEERQVSSDGSGFEHLRLSPRSVRLLERRGEVEHVARAVALEVEPLLRACVIMIELRDGLVHRPRVRLVRSLPRAMVRPIAASRDFGAFEEHVASLGSHLQPRIIAECCVQVLQRADRLAKLTLELLLMYNHWPAAQLDLRPAG
eukprot:5049089-Prymnesium_polylepis.2